MSDRDAWICIGFFAVAVGVLLWTMAIGPKPETTATVYVTSTADVRVWSCDFDMTGRQVGDRVRGNNCHLVTPVVPQPFDPR